MVSIVPEELKIVSFPNVKFPFNNVSPDTVKSLADIEPVTTKSSWKVTPGESPPVDLKSLAYIVPLALISPEAVTFPIKVKPVGELPSDNVFV